MESERGDADFCPGKCGDNGGLETEFLAVKHKSRILRHSSNPVCGFYGCESAATDRSASSWGSDASCGTS